MPPSVRLIAIDIDGTLLPSVGGQVSGRTRRALLEAEAAGIDIVIATGRRQAYAAPLIHPVGLQPETILITSNGTVTRTLAGDRIDRFFLPVETARLLCGALRQFGGLTVFTFDCEGPGELVLGIDRPPQHTHCPLGERQPPLDQGVRPPRRRLQRWRRAGSGNALRHSRRHARGRSLAAFERPCPAGGTPPHRISRPGPVYPRHTPARLLQGRRPRKVGSPPGHTSRRDHGHRRQLQRSRNAQPRRPPRRHGKQRSRSALARPRPRMGDRSRQ